MHRLKFFVTILLCSKTVFSQDLPRISHDTLYSQHGYNLTIGDLVRLGAGSNPVDGSFVYVKRNEDGPYNDHLNILPASWKDVRMHVYRITKRGSNKNGYTFYALLLAHSGPKIQVNLDKAIDAGEIIVPNNIKPPSL